MPNTNLKELGTRLRTARNTRGLTLDQLSDKSGYSSRHIANIEKGDVNPSFEVLSNLVKALGVSFDTVFDPADEQMEVEIQEIAGLYRACPEQGRRLILTAIRAIAHEMMDMSSEN